MWSECSVGYELNDTQKSPYNIFPLFITPDVDTAVFGGIIRLDEQKTIKMGFLKRLKFWKRHNVNETYRNINCKMIWIWK